MHRNPITLEALEVIDAIDRRGSFAKAAEELNKATSALSYTVQKLEEQLDVTLFQRQGRRSVLTQAGTLLLDEGREILHATALLADKTREIATGWEPRLRIAIESIMDYPAFFEQLNLFLQQHPSIEIDIVESVLEGGWDALEHGRVDLVVGAPGPVPQQKGFRTLPIGIGDMTPVIASSHPLAAIAKDPDALQQAIVDVRRIITHDTTSTNVARTSGLVDGRERLYVQTMDQKIAAISSGLGVGHLPRKRIQPLLDNGTLTELHLYVASADEGPNRKFAGNNSELYLAWNLSHKGRALKTLTQQLHKVMQSQ
ncbi:LysR family transcriptional regulator [Aestuariicella sp. G3-2]|uniref:LysR substrate-binding domain-containing protein n=1 Tax=Pseudomaricurvus albidus TaxID=2842452 RepID=UPI001C0D7C3C|nr:LysR substrate-binding domain-containing protein [Aestuariicella albida]MBU3070614.1 LysR family transcriptional regulator [Aestuariicella albida]